MYVYNGYAEHLAIIGLTTYIAQAYILTQRVTTNQIQLSQLGQTKLLKYLPLQIRYGGIRWSSCWTHFAWSLEAYAVHRWATGYPVVIIMKLIFIYRRWPVTVSLLCHGAFHRTKQYWQNVRYILHSVNIAYTTCTRYLQKWPNRLIQISVL